ncbi:uncharacterized protein LOC141884233 isoform X2 [Acropora palmata]|uniref:uncharacterized protein LOC141884233 isoform X2 n=1 Tax=Acropora palmata TaxID=6131 RepID=UPI003DA07050
MFGDKIQKKENLPYGWLTHWKRATMIAKTRPVQVTRDVEPDKLGKNHVKTIMLDGNSGRRSLTRREF